MIQSALEAVVACEDNRPRARPDARPTGLAEPGSKNNDCWMTGRELARTLRLTRSHTEDAMRGSTRTGTEAWCTHSAAY